MSVRLYGRDVGNGSLAVVTRGFREVLEGAGLLEGFVALDRSGGSEEQDASPGALARDGVFTGNLNLVRTMLIGARHERHWVTVTPNSTHIPRDQLAAVLSLPNPRILSASAWGTRVIVDTLREMGFAIVDASADTRVRLQAPRSQGDVVTVYVHTVRHGVSGFAPVTEEIERTRADYEKGEFRVVHFSTTEGQRKGTLELVRAWQLMRELRWLPEKAELLLVLDEHAARALRARMSDTGLSLPDGARLLPRGSLNPAQMSCLLCHMHLVAAPSRGEGFGMIPLSASACGVQTVATLTTGHGAGHCVPPGVFGIPQDDELLPIDDGPGAVAAAVDPQCIARAIQSAHHSWRQISQLAQDAAANVADAWSWQRQLASLVELLR